MNSLVHIIIIARNFDCKGFLEIEDISMRKRVYSIDMTHGPLLGKMLRFAFPLMLSSVLQLLFNAADVIVVGRFAGSNALAAVGSTGALSGLLVNLFIGLSVGANVVVARYVGANDWKDAHEAVHTSVLLSLVGGTGLVVVGLVLAKPLLVLMGTPDEVLDLAAVYMRIFFCGMPLNMLYNFGSAILRSTGDTKRPLYFLIIAGIINVGLNLIFVIVLHMSVAGVALATIISQGVSAVLIVGCLLRDEGICHLSLKQLKFYPDKLKEMVRIGLPAGLQGCVFSLSNVLIQSSVNSFGSIAMAGNTSAANIEGFMYVSMNAMYQTALSFAGQNLGAKEYGRLKKITFLSMASVVVIGLTVGLAGLAFGRQLLGIYSTDPEVIRFGLIRLGIIAPTYFICGMMDVMVGNLRGLGYSFLPMCVSLAGACGLRILWVFTVFQMHHELAWLYYSYPVTWTVTACAHIVSYLVVRRKLDKSLAKAV